MHKKLADWRINGILTARANEMMVTRWVVSGEALKKAQIFERIIRQEIC